MLTVKIKDKRLEERITERAQRIGKSTQEYVNELLATVLPDSHNNVIFNHLNAEDHGYVLNFETIEMEDDVEFEHAAPFAGITDSAAFTKELRNKAWRKK